MDRKAGPAVVSRRTVVGGLCAAGLLAGCSSRTPPREEQQQQKAAAAAQALATGEMDRWAGMVGREFQATGIRVKLTGVRALPTAGARPSGVTRQQAFLAVFDPVDGQPMAGDLIYSLSSNGIAPLDVFMLSGGTTEMPLRMHAVFN
jgi:hypothetical protein